MANKNGKSKQPQSAANCKPEEKKAIASAEKVKLAKPEEKKAVKAAAPQKTIAEKSTPVENKTVVSKADEPLKILFVAGEASPFIRTGGLGDVAGALPKELVRKGVDIRVVIPLYENIPAAFKQVMKFKGYKYVPLSWRSQYCGVFMEQYEGVTYYFLDNEYYFKRGGVYGHFDDGERFAFFSKAVLEVLPIMEFVPDVIHCNDWHTGLVPVFLDSFYRHIPEYQHIKTIFTIHNIEFQGKYDISLATEILGLPSDKFSLVEYKGCVNFMKGGIESASVVTTVSETYAKEILDPFYAYGLEEILAKREFKIHGIINGIDQELFNPATDPALFKNYSLATIEDKEENKKGMCEMISLPYSKEKPLMSMITRLTSQKGLDLVMYVIEEILRADLQLVILGTGDWSYENALKELEVSYPNKLRVIIKFQNDIASKLYAASDIFLMPSKFEPCGLSQLIALKYGTIPIVRETGGLKDTVQHYNVLDKTGNGFSFATYDAGDMLAAIWRAVDLYYNNKKDWSILIGNAMNCDFSWTRSAEKYLDLYKN